MGNIIMIKTVVIKKMVCLETFLEKCLVVTIKMRTVAATVPATPLLESVPRQDFVFI